MGGQQVRTIDLKRAEFQITLKWAVYSLKRWTSMRKCAVLTQGSCVQKPAQWLKFN